MVPLKIFQKISDYEWEIPNLTGKICASRSAFCHAQTAGKSFCRSIYLSNRRSIGYLAGFGRPGAGDAGHAPRVWFPDRRRGGYRLPDGVISPGGIGYDINCGVRLLPHRSSPKKLGHTWMIWPRL